MSDSEKERDKDRDKGQRRVYMLPSELVERITKYQRDIGIASEVEAVRRLLDTALKSRDKPNDLISRFKERLNDTKDLAEIAKDVLVGHPMVTGVRFEDDEIQFSIKHGGDYSIATSGVVMKRSDFGNGWSSYLSLDDDIPF